MAVSISSFLILILFCLHSFTDVVSIRFTVIPGKIGARITTHSILQIADNKKYLLAKESGQTPIYLRGASLFAEFVGPEDDCFMGAISLKDLVFIPLLNTLNILLYIYDRKLCAWPGIRTF